MVTFVIKHKSVQFLQTVHSFRSSIQLNHSILLQVSSIQQLIIYYQYLISMQTEQFGPSPFIEESGGENNFQSDFQQTTKIIKPNDNRLMPFIIEEYNKNSEEHNRERNWKKPKLGVKRLTDEKKLVPLEIDIPVDENTIIKQRFDWNLGKENLAPSEFVEQLCKQLNLDKSTCQKIKLQILSQIVQHIKNNTRRKKMEQKDIMDETFGKPFPAIIRFNNDYIDQQAGQQQNQKKNRSIKRRQEIMKRSNNAQSLSQNKYFKQKKVCKNCKNQNINPGFQCKVCKIPFYIIDILNFDDKRIKLASKYYEKIATKIPLLVYEAKEKQFEKQDFQSFYQIYNKIKSIFQNSAECSKQLQSQIRYIMEIYHQYFLYGNVDFNNDENIIFQKDIKKDQPEQENQVRRKRGRPRKNPLPIIQDGDLLNLNLTSENNNSSSNQENEEESNGTQQ